MTTMKNYMSSSEIRSRFLDFFRKRGHVIIESASLVTTDDRGVTNPTLFNTAGMQPLIPYILGRPYISDGLEIKRLADVQKCLRTVDIDEVGDRVHATFFEMLGNWSLGDYFKKEAISWSYEFLTSKEEGLGLDPNRLYVTVFEGDLNAPRDDEAANIWQEIWKDDTHGRVIDFTGHTSDGEMGRIFYMPAENNWWQAGDNGPCGPDTEMYYDVGDPLTGQPFFGGKGITREQFIEADNSRRIVEVWNDVFMQYEKRAGKVIGKLEKPSVDTGAGLERLAMVMQGVDDIYDTDLMRSIVLGIMKYAEPHGHKGDGQMDDGVRESLKVIADHLKASVFLVADGVIPSNTDRGYILRKLLRRAVRHSNMLGLRERLGKIAEIVIAEYRDIYPEIDTNREMIISEILKEESRFGETLKQGLKEFEKGTDAFTLFSSYGFPLELTLELAKEKGIVIDTDDFAQKFKAHQALSRAGAGDKFIGGLSDQTDEIVVCYHTATHLLHQALRDVLGDKVAQRGSNITAERLRFDFTYGAKMTDDEKKKVEDIVNQKIIEALPVNKIMMSRGEALVSGARHLFDSKYGDHVSVYFIGKSSNPPSASDIDSAYSKEFCGGPHVTNTSELAGPSRNRRFKIMKEEAVAQGIRRIKAVLK